MIGDEYTVYIMAGGKVKGIKDHPAILEVPKEKRQ